MTDERDDGQPRGPISTLCHDCGGEGLKWVPTLVVTTGRR
ncbi:hypothetical protein B0I33_111228 [Prauserella shujinwangii]|uniref:Uncharacterized protein n=1 Tax=Prauserella shujinwangii TaxID=1453103 RepID=A0A2T0LNE6_9PSEU|nr:hypothetical protein B0I33_111228 [Prauserella shujinwangii]